MELHQIRHFAAVVDTGSFTRGALRAGVSQPALSSSVAKLEDEFGVQLLHRTRKAITPTAAGRRLLETARLVLSACDRVKSEMRAADSERPLRLGVLRTLSTAHLARLVKAFRVAMPDTTIELCDGTQDELREKLAGRRLAACVTSAAPPEPGRASIALVDESYGLVVAPCHRFASAESIAIEELEGEPFIVRTHCDAFAAATKLLAEKNVRTRVVYKTDQDDRALALVAAGLGVAFMPSLFDAADVRRIEVRGFDLRRRIELRWNDGESDTRLHKMIAFATSMD